MDRTLGIYIHIPFCAAKCPYCGFYSRPPEKGEGPRETAEKIRAYGDRIWADIRLLGKKYAAGRIVDTVYLGGGTPSMMAPDVTAGILTALRESFQVTENAEITIEVNPGTVDERKLAAYRENGINRLSIGCQSLDDRVLEKLGRIHTSDQFRRTFRQARDGGFENISCDLMFSVPGHTMEIWRSTLEELIEMGPEHVSFYSLQIEEGTGYYDLYRRGQIDLTSDETDRAMYHQAISMLKKAGYGQYEISSCAKRGMECRHNIKYWTLAEYLGIGHSAGSYIDGKRITNEPFYEFHENTERDDMSEYIFTGLRMNRGISMEQFRERFGKDFRHAFPDAERELEPFVASGDAVFDKERLRITEKGFDISNRIMAIFV